MADMHHAIEIEASPEKVYQAIATPKGLRSWWTADSKTDSKVGGSAEFGFDNRGTVFRMRIEELRPPARGLCGRASGTPMTGRGRGSPGRCRRRMTGPYCTSPTATGARRRATFPSATRHGAS